jgi:hypothetical protein
MVSGLVVWGILVAGFVFWYIGVSLLAASLFRGAGKRLMRGLFAGLATGMFGVVAVLSGSLPAGPRTFLFIFGTLFVVGFLNSTWAPPLSWAWMLSGASTKQD